MFCGLATPVYGWWEFIEHLSGPGPFKGYDIEARLVCFVDRTGGRATRLAAVQQRDTAAGSTRQAAQAPSVAAWTAAATAWRNAAGAWEAIAGGEAYKALAARQEAESLQQTFNGSQPAAERLAAAWERTAKAMESLATDGDVRAFAAPGLLYSACDLKPGERRKGAIDFGYRFVWTNPSDRFASRARITLTTMAPAISWSIIDNPNRDFIDYGLGAGVFWISSEAFPSVKGGYLEPVRIDIHAPTNWPWWSRIPIFRFGLLNFPAGFEPDAFAPTATEPRISRDWAKTVGIYGDLEPLIKWLNK
jgi:hypothetical protein